MQTIYLAGGCFWCTEAIFKNLKGVNTAIPGYIGGTVPHTSYEAVCSGTTGHAEAIKVLFDERTISLEDLLDIFFSTHNPTTLNRQGNDIGTQYRSAIFYTMPEQEKIAKSVIAKESEKYTDPIVTAVLPASEFYEAEAYHRDYYYQHTNQPYCAIVINPKLEKLQKDFSDKLK